MLRIDDFTVTIVPSTRQGKPPTACRDRSAARGDVPKVEIVDPVKPHRDLLPRYTDKEIHDITAYLVSVK